MGNAGTRRRFAVVVGLLMAVEVLYTHPIFADEGLECLVSQFAKIKQGLAISPHDDAGCTPGGP
jgi:hypothetical protein